MRKLLFVAAGLFVIAAAFLVFIPFGLLTVGLAVGAVAWFSEE